MIFRGLLLGFILTLSFNGNAALKTKCTKSCKRELSKIRTMSEDFEVLSPDLRLNALVKLGALARKSHSKKVVLKVINEFTPLLDDIQDNIRLEAMTSIKAIALKHGDTEVEQKAIDLLNISIKGSWKVSKETRLKAIEAVRDLAVKSKNAETKDFALIVLKHYRNSGTGAVASSSRGAVKALIAAM